MSYIEKFWRDATAADVTRVMAGETVEARFSDMPNCVWSKVTQLVGAKRLNDTGTVWLSPNSNWRYCQVYAPSQWFLDKPNPGKGYRLLNKFPDEALQPGDECFNGHEWHPSCKEIGDPQSVGVWYRRKIEQPKPEPKFAVGQRVKIVGPKERPAVHWHEEMDKHIGAVADVVSISSVVGEKVFYDLRFIEQWSFREDYLEPVEPKHYVLQVGDSVEFPDGWTVRAMGKGIFIK